MIACTWLENPWAWAKALSLAFRCWKLACSADDCDALISAREICAAVVSLGLGDVGVSGTIEGTSAVAGVCALVEEEPDCRIAWPPVRIEPENADFSDCCSVWYLEMLT